MTDIKQSIADQSAIDEPSAALAKLLARTSHEPALRQRLLADPRGTLASEGLILAEDMTLNVVENSSQRVHFVLPANPAGISDDDLDRVAGGGRIADSIKNYFRRAIEVERNADKFRP